MSGAVSGDQKLQSTGLPPVFIGVGGNIGDRLANLRKAMLALLQTPKIDFISYSRVWESEFVGEGSQDTYLNACFEIQTTLTAMQLLGVLKEIEKRQGRCPDGHNLPRPVDLDILLFGDVISSDPNLTLPHPRLCERAFVLEPLAEIAGEIKFPNSCKTVAEACAKIRRKQGPWVIKYKDELLPRSAAEATKEEWRAALAVHSS